MRTEVKKKSKLAPKENTGPGFSSKSTKKKKKNPLSAFNWLTIVP
jgi:hypothetical protein